MHFWMVFGIATHLLCISYLFCFFIAEIPPPLASSTTDLLLFPFSIAYSCSTSIDCSVLFIWLVFFRGDGAL